MSFGFHKPTNPKTGTLQKDFRAISIYLRLYVFPLVLKGACHYWTGSSCFSFLPGGEKATGRILFAARGLAIFTATLQRAARSSKGRCAVAIGNTDARRKRLPKHREGVGGMGVGVWGRVFVLFLVVSILRFGLRVFVE